MKIINHRNQTLHAEFNINQLPVRISRFIKNSQGQLFSFKVENNMLFRTTEEYNELMDNMDYNNPNMKSRQQSYIKSLYLLENPNERANLNILDTTMISETNPKSHYKLDCVAIRENFDSYYIKTGK